MLDNIGSFLEREAGHIAVGIALIGIGAAFYVCRIPKAEDLIVFALGLIGRSMLDRRAEQK